MPFSTLETIPRDTTVPQASVSYERSKRGRDKFPRLIVSIPTTLSGMCKFKRFTLAIGSGEDAGKARITAVETVPGSAPGTFLKHCVTIRFGKVPQLGEDAAARELTAVRKISDNCWEIDLPAWFKVEGAPAELPRKRA